MSAPRLTRIAIDHHLELLDPAATPPVSEAGTARLYYDQDLGGVQVSVDGGAYGAVADLGTSGVTATAAELNRNAGVTPGTAAASKTAVLGANKNLDTLVLPASGLKIGSGAGTAVDATAAQLNAAIGYDCAAFLSGAPGASAILLRFAAVRAFTLPAALAGSKADAATAATAETILSVKKNGSEIGTITFAIAGTTGTMASASGASFAAGDVLSVVAPGSADATLADISVTLKGSL